ncbi:MAG TPA: hypothetical protein VH143_12835 [Kofleriaceae bacterium]|jgi:hypothetical protein|nr:hypothetical protein [Kofleriaceae bacterium]
MRALIAIIALTSIASANPRYTRSHVAVPHAGPVAAAKPKPPAPSKPAITADQAMQLEQLADPIRRDQEALLEGLAHDTPDDDAQKPDIIFRLAELYALQARRWRLESLKP